MNQELLDQAMAASKAKTIKELFAEDPARAAKYTLAAAGWTVSAEASIRLNEIFTRG